MIERLLSDNIKQIFHMFLFNTRNYSPELNIILPRVNNFGIKQKKLWNICLHGIFVLLYATNTKQDLGR